ncbi:hypothetical protein [Cellulosimicrobium sp. JZ28]|nr:hypothetical protein [Cellulosimicrobium sp. JZ28]
MTPREVLELPYRQWVAMALSVDGVRKERREQARRDRRGARNGMTRARRR